MSVKMYQYIGSVNNSCCDECKNELYFINSNGKKIKAGKNFSIINNKKICNHCSEKINDWRTHNKYCKSFDYIKDLALKFNIELHEGSNEYLKDVQKIKDFVYKIYNEDMLSIPEIEKQYNIKRGFYLLKFFEIKTRSFKEANILAINTGRLDLTKFHNYQYKTEYHTSWDGKKFFLRSSYEVDYANQLDEQKIPYLVEELKLHYWDSQTNSERIAIPDFYLPRTNEIVEIKSTYTFDEQNMKDKFAAYKKFGFKPKLILEKKEINFDIQFIFIFIMLY